MDTLAQETPPGPSPSESLHPVAALGYVLNTWRCSNSSAIWASGRGPVTLIVVVIDWEDARVINNRPTQTEPYLIAKFDMKYTRFIYFYSQRRGTSTLRGGRRLPWMTQPMGQHDPSKSRGTRFSNMICW